jgi:hypothetical protein|nr:MAG TPA: hypothetical protein [Caudoviricetes sp.]
MKMRETSRAVDKKLLVNNNLYMLSMATEPEVANHTLKELIC